MSEPVCYEQPLNERIRVLLRLEFLFQQMDHVLLGQAALDSRAALQGLFDLLAVTGRNELKKELLKELERHASGLSRLRHNDGVNAQALSVVLAEIEDVTQQLHRVPSLAVELVRQNEFLNITQKRLQIPGGACQFDSPQLHYWLQQPFEVRNDYLRQWLAPFMPMRRGVFLLLRLIRTSATAKPEVATKGFFERTLDANAPSQMLRLWLPSADIHFPEISGGRHRFTIRFFAQPDVNKREVAGTADVAFDLACCVI